MDEQVAGERSKRLLRTLERADELLLEARETHWQTWLEKVHSELMAHDAQGLDRLLQGFGGMGSFNDLYLHPVNAHAIAEADAQAANDELSQLRDLLYEDANALRRDLDEAD